MVVAVVSRRSEGLLWCRWNEVGMYIETPGGGKREHY